MQRFGWEAVPADSIRLFFHLYCFYILVNNASSPDVTAALWSIKGVFCFGISNLLIIKASSSTGCSVGF